MYTVYKSFLHIQTSPPIGPQLTVIPDGQKDGMTDAKRNVKRALRANGLPFLSRFFVKDFFPTVYLENKFLSEPSFKAHCKT